MDRGNWRIPRGWGGWDGGRQSGWDGGRQSGWDGGRQCGWDGGRQSGWDGGRQSGWDGGRQSDWAEGRRGRRQRQPIVYPCYNDQNTDSDEETKDQTFPARGPVTIEDIWVPNDMIGHIVGRGGEKIKWLQSESGCKIRIVHPTNMGPHDSVCSLTGNEHAISRAKELINSIVHQRQRTEETGGVKPDDMNMRGGPPCSHKKLQEELEEVKGKLQSLCDIFKCPVCWEILDKDNVSCVNGHSFCRKCRGRQRNCPSCRESFSNVKQNVMVRQVLEVVLPKCKYENCLDLIKPGDDHENYCCYRSTPCRIDGCNWKGQVKELVNHIQVIHHTRLHSENDPEVCHVDFNPNKASSFVNLFSTNGHCLWQIRKNDPTARLLTYTYIPVLNGGSCPDMLVKRSFRSRKMGYTVDIRVTMDENLDHAKENSTSIPTAVLRRFWEQSKLLLPFSMLITLAND